MKSERRELIEALAKLAELSPHWRMGQLVCNVTDYAGEESDPPAVWDVSDAQLLAAARELIRQRKAKESAAA